MNPKANEPVLVTGSSGFIGCHLIEELSKRGHSVVGVDLLPERWRGSTYTHVIADVRDGAALDEVFNRFRPAAVVHLAAETRLLPRAEMADYSSNTLGVQTLLRSMQKQRVDQRLIFASTQLVCELGYTPQSETDFMPTTLYGWSKAYGELAVRALHGERVTWTIVRPTTVWGPGMNEHYRRFLGLLRAGLYWHFNPKPTMRSLGYVKNVTYQLAELLEARRSIVDGKVCYVADYEPVQLSHWVDLLARALGRENVLTVPRWPLKAMARLGDMVESLGLNRWPLTSARMRNIETSQTVDTSVIQSIAGRCPYTVDMGIAETIQWYEGHRELGAMSDVGTMSAVETDH